MTENQKPVVNVDQEEIKLIKATFKDNEELLKTTRACMFGLGLTDDEKELLRSTYSSENLMKIMQKKFLPTLSKEAPIGQVSDIWLGVESQVFGQPRDTIEQSVQYKKMAVDMTAKALEALQDPDVEVPSLDFEISTVDGLQIKLLARNQYIRHVEQQLLFLKVISEQKDETPDEIAERVKKNSSK